MSAPIYPLPEVVCPGVWSIEEMERGGHVIPEDRVIAVPLDATRFARAVRAHEMSHICFSPDEIAFERLGVGRWTAIFLGLFGSYGRNDSVDVQYRLGGRDQVAVGLDIVPPG